MARELCQDFLIVRLIYQIHYREAGKISWGWPWPKPIKVVAPVVFLALAPTSFNFTQLNSSVLPWGAELPLGPPRFPAFQLSSDLIHQGIKGFSLGGALAPPRTHPLPSFPAFQLSSSQGRILRSWKAGKLESGGVGFAPPRKKNRN